MGEVNAVLPRGVVPYTFDEGVKRMRALHRRGELDIRAGDRGNGKEEGVWHINRDLDIL